MSAQPSPVGNKRRSFKALVLLVAAAMALTVTSQAVASASPTPQFRDRAALGRHDRLLGQAHTRPAMRRSSTRSAGKVAPHASSKISGPALVFTDFNATGLQPSARDLTSGAKVGQAPFVPSGCLIEPRLSPDGTTYALVHFVDPTRCTGTSTLYTVGLSGAVVALAVAPTNAWFAVPNWSPDGSTILYTMEQDDASGNFVSSQLYTIPAAGGSPTAIGGGGVMGFEGVYSPNGAKIVYAANVDTNANYLAIMNADGTGSITLPATGLSSFSPGFPAWSPEGSKITFQYDKAVGTYHNFGIAMVNADGTGVHVLPVTAGANTDAFVSSWSADGTEVFFDAVTRNTSTGVNSVNGSIYATDATSGTYRSTILAATAFDWYFDPFFVGPGPSTGAASSYRTVAPTRVLNRTNLAAGGTLDLQVSGGTSPVPSNATAVTLNLTGVSPTAATYLQVYPTPVSGAAFPTVSNLNLSPGLTAAVAVQVSVPVSGFVRLRNAFGTTGVIVDVSGYFVVGTGAALYTPLTPVRALDTTLTAGASHDVNLASYAAAIPGLTPVAAVVNLTGATPTAVTYLSVYPTPAVPTSAPLVSNLNLSGATRANLATVPIGSGGAITVFNAHGAVRTIIDVEGFYGTGATGALAYYPLAPTRILDTRVGTGTLAGSTASEGSGVTLNLPVLGTTTTAYAIVTVPASARAFVLNVTATAPSTGGYLTVWGPPTVTRPGTSTVNFPLNATVPNLVITGSDATGLIAIYNRLGSTAVIGDLAGYFAP